MTKNLLTILFVVFTCLSFNVKGQTNEPATGNFDITSNGTTVSVHYSVANAYPSNLAVQFAPSASFTLNSRIVDGEGNEKMKIKQETVNGRYANSIDISALAAGNYYLEVATGGDPYRISFTK